MNSKWWVALLVASLALNLVLVGFFLGREANPFPSADPTMVYPRWARTLPEERMDALRPTIRKHRRAARTHVRDLRGAHGALRDAIIAEPFDSTALQDALQELRRGLLSTQEISHGAFAEFVGQLTPAERQALAQDLMRRPHRGNRLERPDRPRDGPAR